MYKISKKLNKHPLNNKQFNSSTAPKINHKKLEKIINELFDEVN